MKKECDSSNSLQNKLLIENLICLLYTITGRLYGQS